MPGWRPHCLRGSIYETQPINFNSPTEPPINVHEIEDDRRGIAVVELQRKEGCGLGLTVTGGSDKGSKPKVSNLRAGSIAQRSDALVVGEVILSVNGIRTTGLKHDEIINLLKNAGEKITLEVEYEMPELPSSQANMQSRQWEVTLDKEGPGYGFTLRGGMKVDNMQAFPLTVVAIRAGSSTHRDGHLKVGDRIMQVNGYKVTHLALTEMWSLLQQCGHQTTFTVAYDVAVMDAVENASGPLLVEIDKTPGAALGIVLTHSSYQRKACVCVESIRPMSVADRSGALHKGDHILSIDGACVEHMSVAEATQLLKSGTDSSVKLEILPVTHLQHCASREALARKSLVPSLSSVTLPSVSPAASVHNGICTMPAYGSHAGSASAIAHFATLSRGSRGSGLSKYTWPAMDRKVNSCMSMVSTSTSVRTANNQVCHSETAEVMLFADAKGLGIVLEGGIFSTAVLSHPPTIASIDPRSAADKCGVLQEGDRILQVNGMDTTERTLEEVNQFLRESRPRCVLEIEFDVAESVTPSCGTYTVKLAKKAGGTGITVGGRRRPSDPLVITDVRRGGAAHRCGSIQPGDKLLAINDVCLKACTVEDAAHLLELPDEIVKLKLQRDDPDEGSKDCVTYTVQLQRHGGPLGITISGTEDPLDDIIISELTAGGLAQKTGAMHVGDRLLGINDSTTKNKPLSEAIRMLQSAGDLVTLKIARPFTDDSGKSRPPSGQLEEASKRSTPIPSIDSAMESWDSLGQDVSGGCSAAGGGGNTHAMLVAVPHQLNRLSTASSGQMRFRNSAILEGNAAGKHTLPETNLSDDDWLYQDENAENSQDIDDDEDTDCGQSLHSEASSVEVEDWARTLGDLEASSGSEMLRQISASLRQRSTFSLDRRSNASDSRQQQQQRATKRSQSTSRIKPTSKSHDSLHRPEGKPRAKDAESGGSDGGEPRTFDQQLQAIFTPTPIQLHRVTLEKNSAVADFGFSLSDGMYEKGVYVSAVRTGSPAQRAGLRAFDRILQVNRLKTRDFDCRMTVPLIAEASNKLNLVICRNPLLHKPPALRDSQVLDGQCPDKNKPKPSGSERNSQSSSSATLRPGGEADLEKRDKRTSAASYTGVLENKEAEKPLGVGGGQSQNKELLKFTTDKYLPSYQEVTKPPSTLSSFQVRKGRTVAGSAGDLNAQDGAKRAGGQADAAKPGSKPAAEKNAQKASTLPGMGTPGASLSAKVNALGKKLGTDGSKPAVAAKSSALGKPPISHPVVKPPAPAAVDLPPTPLSLKKYAASTPLEKPDSGKESTAVKKSPEPVTENKPAPKPLSIAIEKPLVFVPGKRHTPEPELTTAKKLPAGNGVKKSAPETASLVAVEKPLTRDLTKNSTPGTESVASEKSVLKKPTPERDSLTATKPSASPSSARPPVAEKTSVALAVARLNSARAGLPSKLQSPGTLYGGCKGTRDSPAKDSTSS